MQVITNTMRGKDYESIIDNATERALSAIGVFLEGEAVVRVPVDTGRLKGSLTWATKKDRSFSAGADGVSTPRTKHTLHVGSNVEYAQHVEYGSRGKSAQPFLRPALNDNRTRVAKLYKEEISKGLQRGK